MELEEDTTVLNNATKVHNLLIKIIHLRERILFQMVNFHKKMPKLLKAWCDMDYY